MVVHQQYAKYFELHFNLSRSKRENGEYILQNTIICVVGVFKEQIVLSVWRL